MTFAKIFEQIFDSSIANDWKARVVFQDMLVLADKDGVVDRTPEALARRTNLPLEMVLEAIPKLEAPDESSRTPDCDGRRIVRLDAHRNWGWRIVNFQKYRESATTEMLRMAEAERKRAYRAKFKPPFPHTPNPKTEEGDRDRDMSRDMSGTRPGHSTPRQQPTIAAVAAASNQAGRVSKPYLEDVKAQARRIELPESEAERFFNYYESNGWRVGRNPMKSWKHALSNWKSNCHTGFAANARPRNTRAAGTLNENVNPTDYDTLANRPPPT